MISRKDRYQSKKSKTLIFMDVVINIIASLWNKHGGWILLGIIIGTILSLPGWLYVIFE